MLANQIIGVAVMLVILFSIIIGDLSTAATKVKTKHWKGNNYYDRN